MGVRFRRTVRIAPGVRINVTKTGLGVRVGPRGAGVSLHSSGRLTASAGLPGSGLYYSETTTLGRLASARTGSQTLGPLQGAALKDARRGGGASYDRLWQTVVETCDRHAAAAAVDLVRQVSSVLTPEEWEEFARAIVATGQTAAQGVAKLLDDQPVNQPWRNAARLTKRLGELSNDDDWLEQFYGPVLDMFAGLPFYPAWVDATCKRFADRMLDNFCELLPSGPMAGALEQWSREPSDVSQAVARAYSHLRLGTPEAARRATGLLLAARREGLETAEVVLVPVTDHLELSVPVGPDAVNVGLVWAWHLGDRLAGDHYDRNSELARLMQARLCWLKGERRWLLRDDPPQPEDDITALTCLYYADVYDSAQGRSAALTLLDAAAEAATSPPVRAEVLLHRAWVRRAAGDTRYLQDLDDVRLLDSHHPGLWAAPDPDRPAAELVGTEQVDEVTRAAYPLLAVVQPDAEHDRLARWAAVIATAVLGSVIVADGEISAFEADAWVTDDASIDGISGTIRDWSVRFAPHILVQAAVAAQAPAAEIARFVDAVVELAQSTALTDGEVTAEEHRLVNGIVRLVREAARPILG